MEIGRAQFNLPNGGQNLLKFGIGHSKCKLLVANWPLDFKENTDVCIKPATVIVHLVANLSPKIKSYFEA